MTAMSPMGSTGPMSPMGPTGPTGPTGPIFRRWPLVLALALFLVTLGLGCGGSDDDGDDNPITPTATSVLAVGNAEGAAGDTTTITISLENTEPLVGLQFDLLHNPSVLTVVEATSTTRTSGFEVFHSTPTSGNARVLLTDLSGTAQLAQGGGAVVTLRVAIDDGAPLGATSISTSDGLGTDLSATPVSLGSSSGTLTVR